MKQVFVSYVYEDKDARDTVEAWAHAGKLGEVRVSGETQDMRQHGETAIRGHLYSKLNGASTLVLLVGDNAHNHDWVRYEVDVMKSAGKPVVVVRLPGTTGAAPPSVRGQSTTAFEPEALRRALGT